MLALSLLFTLSVFSSVWFLVVTASSELDLKEFDEKAYHEWGMYTLEEKLPYILDASMKQSFEAEFEKLSLQGSGVGVDPSIEVPVSYLTLFDRFSEFLQPEDIQQYMDTCDRNKNEEIELLEYILCRGEFDAYLSPHGLGEYDTLESVLIHDYEEKRNDPNFRIPGLNYDENGIIID